MKKLFWAIVLIVISLLLYKIAVNSDINYKHSFIDYNNNGKKKVLIFTSRGGGGHISATKALDSYLRETYDIKAAVFLEGVMNLLDPIAFITLKNYTCDDFYNFLLQRRWIRLINALSWPSGIFVYLVQNQIKQRIIDYLRHEKPELVISVIPLFNKVLLEACKELSIPFLVVTVDLDTHLYVENIYKPDYKNFYYTLAFDDTQMKEKIAKAQIPQSQIKIVGFPVQTSFLKTYNTAEVKKKFNLPQNKPVIMLLMGATGSSAIYSYINNIIKSNIYAHIIICLGRNASLKEKLDKLKLPNNLTLSIFGFTNEIAQLMAVSDLIITKPGPTSVCEAIYSNLPMILDKTGSTLFWEKLDYDFVLRYKLGEILTRYSDLPSMLNKFLKDKQYYLSIKNNLLRFNQHNPELAVKELVDSILSK